MLIGSWWVQASNACPSTDVFLCYFKGELNILWDLLVCVIANEEKEHIFQNVDFFL